MQEPPLAHAYIHFASVVFHFSETHVQFNFRREFFLAYSVPGPVRLIKYSGNNGNPGASGSRRDESDQKWDREKERERKRGGERDFPAKVL